MIDWQAYQRCHVCFRTYDCRSLRRGRTRTVKHIVTIEDWDHFVIGYKRISVPGVPAGWYDRTLKRPHRGRRRRHAQSER